MIYKKITLRHIVLILGRMFFSSAFSSSAVFNSLNFLLHDIFNQPATTNNNREQGLKEKKHAFKITLFIRVLELSYNVNYITLENILFLQFHVFVRSTRQSTAHYLLTLSTWIVPNRISTNSL